MSSLQMLVQATSDLYHDLFEDEGSKDVAIECSDGTVRAHACVLSAASQPLKAMLSGGFSEGRDRRVQLPDLSADEVRFILCAMYTGHFTSEDAATPVMRNYWSRASAESSDAAVVSGDSCNVLTTKQKGGVNFVVLGEHPYERGQHYFEVKVLKRDSGGNGYHILGVATSSAKPTFPDYQCGPDIWGLYLDKSARVHDNQRAAYGTNVQHSKGSVYGVLLDCDEGTLTFFSNGYNLGKAYSNLKGKGPFYPVLCVGCLSENIYEADFNPQVLPASIKIPVNRAASTAHLFALASFCKKYDMMQFAAAAIEALKTRITEKSFDDIMRFATRFDVVPIKLVGLEFARSSQTIKELYEEQQLSPEVMWDLHAVWPGPPRKKLRGSFQTSLNS